MIAHGNASSTKPARVVLVGAGGFIGAALRMPLEAAGIPVLALRSADVDLSVPTAANALAEALRPSDAVVMLAAITPDKGRDAKALIKNLAMMDALCGAIAKVGCAHLVYFSSDAVYDPAVSRVAEETPASPRDLYGAMHYTRELMARVATRAPVLVLRPTLVYGVGDTHNAYGPNRFRRAAQKEHRIALFGGGEELRDHIHVNDVAALAARCLMHASSGTLNMATGRSWSFRQVADVVARQFEAPIEIVETPRANPITYRHYDVTNLLKAFADFRFTSLEEGIARVHREATAGGR